MFYRGLCYRVLCVLCVFIVFLAFSIALFDYRFFLIDYVFDVIVETSLSFKQIHIQSYHLRIGAAESDDSE